MDNEYRLDTSEILKTLRRADVVVFRFVTVPQRLLLDFRHSDVDPPMLKLVQRANSAEDRFRNLKQLRPRFKLPEKISAVWWPRFVRRLEDEGVWDSVLARLTDEGYPAVAGQAAAVLAELRDLERTEMSNAIEGEGYKTLWPARRA